MILNDYFNGFQRTEKERLINLVMEMSVCTVVIVSNDPAVLSACDRVVIMDDGRIKADSNYKELLAAGYLSELVND